MHGRDRAHRRRPVEQVVDARGDLVEPPDDGGRVALGKGRHDVLAERIEPLLQALDRILRGNCRIVVGKRHLQLLAERGQLLFQAPDGGFRRRPRLAVQRRIDAAAEFGDAHLQPLDGPRAVVVFQCAPERRDFLAERIEPAAVEAPVGKFFQPARDRLGARFDLFQRRVNGVFFHHAAQRCQVGADGGEQRAVDRRLGRQRIDAAGEVEGRPAVLGAGAAERGHLPGEAGKIGAQRRKRGGKRRFLAVRGALLAAPVEPALMRRNLGNGRFEVVAPVAPRRGGARRRAVALGKLAADIAEPPLDARDLVGFAGRRGIARLDQACLGFVDARFQSAQCGVDRRRALAGFARPRLGPAGKQGIQPRADVVERRVGLARRWRPLAHPGDALVEVVNGLRDTGDVDGRRHRSGGALTFDHRAGTFVGILDVAGEFLDHCGNPLQGAVGPPTLRLTGKALLDLVEAPEEIGNRCARPLVHGAQACRQAVERCGDRRRVVAIGGRRVAEFVRADGVVQPFVDGKSGASCCRVDSFARLLVDPPEAPRHARSHCSTPRRGAGGQQDPVGRCRISTHRKESGVPAPPPRVRRTW